MKFSYKIIIVLLAIFALTCVFTIRANAEDRIDTSDYDGRSGVTYQEGEYLFDKAATILTILRAISVIVAVLSLSILGIKYMVGSLEEKAQYKEKLLPIAIGAILVGSISGILISISSVMNS